MLGKFVRRHHQPEKIIGDAESSVMTRKIFKDDTCLLCEIELKPVKSALDNENHI